MMGIPKKMGTLNSPLYSWWPSLPFESTGSFSLDYRETKIHGVSFPRDISGVFFGVFFGLRQGVALTTEAMEARAFLEQVKRVVSWWLGVSWWFLDVQDPPYERDCYYPG